MMMTPIKYDLIVFDLDDTLVKAWTDELLPNVAEFFAGPRIAQYYAIATNQGGVGLRLAMEKGGWGDNPESLPTLQDAQNRIGSVLYL